VGEIVGVNNLNALEGEDPLSGLIGTYYLIKDEILGMQG